MKNAILKTNKTKKPGKAALNGSTFKSEKSPTYKEGDVNLYEKGATKILTEKKLTLKNIKMFNGRDGIGCSASIYFNGKRCGDFLDEANGGEYYHEWNYNCPNADKAGEYLKSLPHFSDVEWKKAIKMDVESYDTNKQNNGWKWYWADVIINEYEKNKTYNKWLRKIVIFNTKTQKIEHYKALATCLKDSRYRKAFNAIGGVILNDLSKQEAYNYFNQYK